MNSILLPQREYVFGFRLRIDDLTVDSHRHTTLLIIEYLSTCLSDLYVMI